MKPFNIYIFLLCLIPYFPVFNSLDVIGFQWFALSFLNFLFIIYLLINAKSFVYPNTFWFNVFYLTFIFFCLISLFFSYNFKLSIIDFSRIINTFLSILILYNIRPETLKFQQLSFFISILLLVDIFFSFKPILDFSFNNSLSFFKVLSDNSNPAILKGLNGNKNITATFMLFKLPFLLYYLTNNMITGFKILFSLALFFSVAIVTLILARAAYLSLFIFTLVFLLHSLFYSKKSLIFIPIIFISFFVTSLYAKNVYGSSISNEITSISFTNESSSSRFQLWENAIDASINNNFIGFGIGQWKIESLPYWNINGSDYIVPYHAHNDFLELLAEIGLIGALSYLSIFIFSFLLIFSFYKKSRSLVDITIGSSLFVYFFDANLNFPLERFTMQLFFILLIFLILNRYEKKSY